MAQRIDVALDELYAARQRSGRRQLDLNDFPLVDALLDQFIASTERRQERMAAKAAAAARAASGPQEGAATERDAEDSGVLPSTASDPAETDEAHREPESHADRDANEAAAPEKPKGHGRNGASAFRKAEHILHVLAGVIGAVCEVCGFGKMYRYREKVIIRVIGQPMFFAEAHHYEQARCRECGHIARAPGPACVHEGVGSDYVRYDWSACAMLMVMHYFSGSPSKRLESLHEGWGVPLADANQWAIASTCHDLLLPLFKALERHAIRTATNFRIDDTHAVVIELQKEINAEIAALEDLGEPTKDVRTGINATGSYWETPDGTVILFYTGRHHAGEIVDQLLEHRPLSSPKLIKSTDAASKNFDHAQGDKLIETVCNAHALLKFRDIKDKYPAEYAEAGSVYKQVFDNDDKIKELELTPEERMLYHRKHSKPLMEKLKKYCAEKLANRQVEPNSAIWEPLTFIVNQWDRLIQFCHVPGVPLDTNLVEQALIITTRYRGCSFNYQTVDGAVVGDRAMSMIATGRANGVEPVAYLTECLRCHEDLAERPEYYLPWAYRERMKSGTSPPIPDAEVPREDPGESTSMSTLAPDVPARLRDLAPELGEGAVGGVAAPDQDLQLARE